MDKSSITCTSGSDWWLSRTTMGGKERYPKQIRVGDLDRPRVYYPVDRDELLELADRMEHMAGMGALLAAHGLAMAAASIREACGEVVG